MLAAMIILSHLSWEPDLWRQPDCRCLYAIMVHVMQRQQTRHTLLGHGAINTSPRQQWRHATTEELLEAVFSFWSVSRLHYESQRDKRTSLETAKPVEWLGTWGRRPWALARRPAAEQCSLETGVMEYCSWAVRAWGIAIVRRLTRQRLVELWDRRQPARTLTVQYGRWGIYSVGSVTRREPVKTQQTEKSYSVL
jgi:hypothetical protein